MDRISAPPTQSPSVLIFPQPPTPRIALPRELKAQVWYFTHGKCWYCGTSLNPYENLCIDHVMPLARGGGNEIENLVPCCTHCNASKGTLTVDEWRNNFITIPIDEEPWIDPSGVFWFERDAFYPQHRAYEIRGWHRYQANLKRNAS